MQKVKWLIYEKGDGRAVVSVVIPVFNNEFTLKELWQKLTEIREQLYQRAVDIEFIFVDDGSQDNSLAILDSLDLANCDSIIALTRNFGAVNASTEGIRASRGGAVIVLSADLQDPPELINDLVNAWLEGELFVVFERTSRQDPMLNRVFSNIFYFFVRKFIFEDFPKGGFDLFLLDESLVPILTNSSKNSYMPILLWWIGVKPRVLKYERLRRYGGKSQWSFEKRRKAFIDSLISYSQKPVRLIIRVSFVICGFAFSYGLLVLASALFGRREVPGFASTLVFISFLGALTIMLISLVLAYQWRILEQLDPKPRTVITRRRRS